MQAPPKPLNEANRLAALRRYDLLDTPPEQALDDLAALAAQICGTPISLISLVDDQRQWFKSRIGMAAAETPRDISFCGHAIVGHDLFIVPDASTDPRFFDNPLVTEDPGVRFYAGASLLTATGEALGALCVMDQVPRQLSESQQEALRILGRQVMAQIELRRHNAKLAKRHDRLFAVFRNCPVPMAVNRWHDGAFVDVNAAFCRMTGYSRDQLIGKSSDTFGLVKPVALEALRTRLAAGETIDNVDLVIHGRDGESHNVLFGLARTEINGEPHAVSTFVDISDRRRIEAALFNSEERLRLALDAARMGTFDWDVRSGSWLASSTYYTMLGYAPEAGLVDRMVWFNRIHPEDRERVAGLVKALVEGATAKLDYEARIRHADGSWRWAELKGRVLATDDEGKPTRVAGVRLDITERKQAEAALRERQQLLEEAQRIGQVGSWVYDVVAGEVSWTAEMYCILGADPAQVAPSVKGYLAFIHPDDRPRAQTTIDRAIHTGRAFDFEQRIVRPDGTIRIVQTRGQIERDSSGQPSRLIAICQDLTERKAAEEARLTSEARYSTLFASAPDGLIIADGNSYYVDANPAMCRMLGYTRDELIGLHGSDIVAPAEVEHILPALEKIQATSDYHREWLFKRKDGTTFPVEVIATTMPDGLILGMIRDITERKQAEQRIEHLNRVYAVLSDINKTIVREREPNALLNAACQIAVTQGKFKMAWIGLRAGGRRPLRIAAHAGGDADTMRLVASMQGDGERDGICDFTMLALQNGAHVVCNDIAGDPRAAPWRDAALERGYLAMAALPLIQGDRVVGVLNLYADQVGQFTAEELKLLDELSADIAFALEMHQREAQRHVIERALRDSEERFRQLADNIREVFWMTDPETQTMLYVSPAYETIWGRPAEELYSSPKAWLPAIHPDDRVRVDSAESNRTKVEDYDETYRIVRPDGTIRWIHDRAFPVVDAHGRLIRVVGTAEDITDRRELETQLRQSQKMEAVGQLAGGVAHDFNNLLTVIQGFGSLLTMGDQTPEETTDAANQIVQAADKAASLTRQLLAFSRRQVMHPRLVDLNDLITGLAKMLQRIVGEDVNLSLDPHPRPVTTLADPGLMDQVLMNLVVNARDAMPAGGRITIETGRRDLTEREARAIPGTSPGSYAWVSVRDTGTGISAADMPRIFEPFFTTKDPGKGTGLGLATVFGIVTQHRGAVQVESEVGRGTTFRVYLPAADPAAANTDSAERRARPRRGSETVLVVEDEPSVRHLTCVVLQQHGYTVLEAMNGRQALALWEGKRDEIDLVVTDIVMPEGMSGRDLATRLRAQSPELKVIYTSGYSREIAGKEMPLEQGRNFVQKPFMPDELLATVRRCLDT